MNSVKMAQPSVWAVVVKMRQCGAVNVWNVQIGGGAVSAGGAADGGRGDLSLFGAMIAVRTDGIGTAFGKRTPPIIFLHKPVWRRLFAMPDFVPCGEQLNDRCHADD